MYRSYVAVLNRLYSIINAKNSRNDKNEDDNEIGIDYGYDDQIRFDIG